VEIQGEKSVGIVVNLVLFFLFPYLAFCAQPDPRVAEITDDQYRELAIWLFKIPKVPSARWGERSCKVWEGLCECLHTGVDYPGIEGVTSVYAIADGRVIRVERGRKCRTAECLSTLAIYNPSINVTFLYLHMETIEVEINQWVKIGERLGTVGARGKSTNPHLHFEVRFGKHPYASLCIDSTLNPYNAAKRARAQRNNRGDNLVGAGPSTEVFFTLGTSLGITVWQTTPHAFADYTFWAGAGIAIRWAKLSFSLAIAVANLQDMSPKDPLSLAVSLSLTLLEVRNMSIYVYGGAAIAPRIPWVAPAIGAGVATSWNNMEVSISVFLERTEGAVVHSSSWFWPFDIVYPAGTAAGFGVGVSWPTDADAVLKAFKKVMEGLAPW